MTLIKLFRSLSHRPRFASPLAAFSRASSSDSHHDEEPTKGYLFGRPPGEKVAMEYWEPVWYIGYYGSMVTLLIAYFFFHDHRSIEDRARLEAHKRMALKGEKFGWPLPPDYALVELVDQETSEA